jgi:hypothetical protein
MSKGDAAQSAAGRDVEQGNIREGDKWEWDIEEGDIEERNVRKGGKEEGCKEGAQRKGTWREGTRTPEAPDATVPSPSRHLMRGAYALCTTSAAYQQGWRQHAARVHAELEEGEKSDLSEGY